MCADYEYIHKVSASQTNETKRIPIIGNGDILSYTGKKNIKYRRYLYHQPPQSQ